MHLRFVALFAFITACASAIEAPFAAPKTIGRLEAPPKLETSGLAASHRSQDILWTHDDSGGEAAIYAVRATGKRVGVLRIRGTRNEDWEDIAAFKRDGKAWLLIGDVGDNDAERSTVQLHLVEEPPLEHFAAAGELSVAPTRTWRVRYEDGPRDCESVAVDVDGRAIYLLTKRDATPRLYRVDLDPVGTHPIVLARHVANVSGVPQPTKDQQRIKGYLGKRRGQVCAMDFASDASGAVVLTYGDVLWFARRAGEPWAETLARDPVALPAHDLVQAEGACFSPDSKAIFVAAEGIRALVRYDRR